jgi:hypothetical protein
MEKKTALFVLMFFLTVYTCLNSFADEKEKYGFYVPSDNEVLYGTWINTTYTGPAYRQKVVMFDWGYWEEYAKVTDTFFVNGTYTIVDKWTDSESNVWYTEYIRMRNGMYPLFEIDKISKSGTVWEYVFGYDDFPTADNMHSKNPYYRIRYRE